MPGSWELTHAAANSVLVATLTRETVTTAWAGAFKHLQIPGSFTFLSGMPFDHARNSACQKLLELGWDWLFFLDDDVLCPPDTIVRLLAYRQPIISGLYFRRNEPLLPVMLKEVEGGGKQWITDYPANAIIQVDYVGAGCLLIHKSVLTKLPPLSARCHWFDWQVDRTDLPADQKTSEDFTFCRHARNQGFKILVDTGIVCEHAGLSKSKDGKLTPLTAG